MTQKETTKALKGIVETRKNERDIFAGAITHTGRLTNIYKRINKNFNNLTQVLLPIIPYLNPNTENNLKQAHFQYKCLVEELGECSLDIIDDMSQYFNLTEKIYNIADPNPDSDSDSPNFEK
jgi:hypothetical protein